MANLIYLSRHGRTLDNTLSKIRKESGMKLRSSHYDDKLGNFQKDGIITTENLRKYLEIYNSNLNKAQEISGIDFSTTNQHNLKDVTPYGMLQAKRLGEYIKYVTSKNPVFVVSTEDRTLQTVRAVADSANYDLERIYHCDDLCERYPFEFANIPEEYIARLRRNPRFGTVEEIAEETFHKLTNIAYDHPEETIVAILHGARNASLLNYYELASNDDKRNSSEDNAGIWKLSFGEEVKLIEPYKRNSELI